MDIGDIVYIYVGKPFSEIRFKCQITKINLEKIEIDDSEFIIDGILSYLKKSNAGLSGNPTIEAQSRK